MRSSRKHNIREIHWFCQEHGFNVDVFKPYRQYIKAFKYGKRYHRCELTKKVGHQNGMQVHHIIPRCLGGKGRPENTVFLTQQEHIVAHQILQKCLEDTGNIIFAMRHRH